MGNILKETFAILNKNLWLLFLFMTVSSIGMIYFSILRASANTAPEIIIGAITLLFLAVAGLSGFFNTLRATIDAENHSNEVWRFDLLKAFPKGVSEYFLSALGIVLLYLVITFLMFNLALFIGKNFIGMFSFTTDDLSKAFGSMEALMEFQKNLSNEDLIKLTQWHMLYTGITSIMTYLLIYWLPETFYNTKNSLLALFRAVKKAVLKPFNTLKLFIVMVLINIATSVIIAFLVPIPFLMFLVYFVYFYGFLYILMLIFNYYRHLYTERVVVAELVEEEVQDDGETDE